MKTAIIGVGWVGKAMHQLFPDAYLYSSSTGYKEDVNKRDVAFVCVPTPNPSDYYSGFVQFITH